MIESKHSAEARNSRRRFAAFFNIEPGEERLVGLLVLLYFILALGFVFVQSMAFGVFLSEYGVQGLPYSYIAIAIFASLVAVFYSGWADGFRFQNYFSST